MTPMTCFPITDSALRWLETILAERFGHAWRLARTDEGLELSLVGANGTIVFGTLCDGFTQARSDLPFTQWDAEREGWASVLGGPLPAPGLAELASPLIEQNKEKTYIHYDILGLAYWMMARVEEIGRTDLDNHGRFPATSSHALKRGYLERPVVDEWLNVLGQVIQRQWQRIDLKRHKFSIVVSHDVDRPYQYFFMPGKFIARQIVGDLFKRYDLQLSIERVRTWQLVRSANLQFDPYNTFDWVMDQSEKHDLISAFYFICGRSSQTFDADYQIDHPVIRSLLRHIHDRGHEIGLHPSYETYLKPELIELEFRNLRKVCVEEGINQKIWGARMHYLRYANPSTMCALNAAGLSYDSTLGYADYPGFRCGTSFEYPGYDAVEQNTLAIRLRPLVMTDWLYSINANQNTTLYQSEVINPPVLINVKKIAGCFHMLWHNCALSDDLSKIKYCSLLGTPDESILQDLP